MKRASSKRLRAGSVLVLGGLLVGPMRAMETLENGAMMDASPLPPVADAESPRPMKPLKKAKRAVSRTLARAVQPFLNYPRHHLVRLLPSRKHLPDHLAHREHWDYPGPLQWVPRGWTTYDWGKPAMVLGNQERHHEGAPKPIGERGSFQLSVYPELPPPFCWVPAYVAFTLPNGVHFRFGARWDDVDAYVNLPSVAIKKRVQ